MFRANFHIPLLRYSILPCLSSNDYSPPRLASSSLLHRIVVATITYPLPFVASWAVVAICSASKPALLVSFSFILYIREHVVLV